MSSSVLTDYLGEGTAASRPASLSIAATALGLYFATDTGVLSSWNGAAWVQLTLDGALKFSAGATQSTTADTYYFTANTKYPGRIVSATSFVASGTETYTITINGTPVTGLTTIAETAVVGSKATHNASGANTFAAGATLGLVVTGSGLGFNVTLNLA